MKSSLVWQLELVNYFVKNYNYQIIKLVDGRNQKDNDFWLFNREHKKYTIIRISDKNLPLNEIQINNINNYSDEMNKLIGNTKEMLNIHVVEYDGELEENYISITDKTYNGIDISEYFIDIKKVLKPVDNPVEEINRITMDLNEYIKKKRTNIFGISRPKATLIIIIICLIFYTLINIFSNNFNSVVESQIFFGAYYKIFIMAGEYHRFLTVGLTHGNTMHLLMNMLALYNLGRILELVYGSFKFIIILIISTIGGSVLTYILDNAVVATGLSGGIFGLLGALLVYYFHSGIIKNPALRSNIVSILLINGFISLLPGIAFYGHLGGFLFGVLIGILFTNNISWKTLKKNSLISLIILVFILGYKVVTVNKSSLEGIYLQTDIQILKNYEKIGLDYYARYLEKKLIEIYKYY